MTSDQKRKLAIFASVLVLAVVFLLPTAMRSSFEGVDWISKPIGLGLDLRGGAHILFRVQTEEAVKSRLQITANSVRSELLKAKVPAPRAKATDKLEIEITLFRAALIDRAKTIIEEEYKDLLFLGETRDGSKPILRYGITEAAIEEIKRNSVVQSVETIRNRVDQFGVAEPVIQRAGEDRIILEMPGATNIDSVMSMVQSVARLEFRLLPNAETQQYQEMLEDRDGGEVAVESEVRMTGESVDDARVSVFNGQVEVSLTLTSEGARTFRKITTDNVNRRLAIILDNVVYSSPNINEPIAGGRASISGGFTHEEARQLAVVLRAGALPAPLDVLEKRTVGPTLGQESIERGVTAIIIGFVLVVLFMVVYYRKAGGVAVTILAINVLLVMAALSAFGATLTLPGLAGLALTIGMAVDANVIIFERIREEVRNGSGRDAAVSAGFERALSAIIDSNLTTLLAGLILYYFGTGPIRGFAVTLSVGILTTIYCATFVSRLAFDVLPLKDKNGKLAI